MPLPAGRASAHQTCARGSRARSPSPLRGVSLAACVRRSPSPSRTGGAHHAHCKLEQATERFSAFLTDLQKQQQERRAAEAARLQALADGVAKLERGVEAECKRRADADAAMQAHVQDGLRAAAGKAAAHYDELTEAYKGSLEGLARGLQDLQAAIKEEREQRRREAERVAANLLGKVGECAAAVQQESAARGATQGRCARQAGADLLRLQEALAAEASARASEAAQLRSEVLQVVETRDTCAERFKAAVSAELAALRGDVDDERVTREVEDDTIVDAVNDYTSALQDGLRLAMAE